MTLGAGTRIGPYELVSLLGAGGMGEVYRARDTRLMRDVAIKVLPPAFASHPDRVERFSQEARATAAFDHPNILAIYDVGVHDDLHYVWRITTAHRLRSTRTLIACVCFGRQTIARLCFRR